MTRKDSPANMGEYHTPLLLDIKVSDVPLITNIYADLYYSIHRAAEIMRENSMLALPVVHNDQLLGSIYMYDIENKLYGYVNEYYRPGTSYVKLENSAESAWEIMMKNRTTWCAVTDNGKFLGIITLKNLLQKYNEDINQITRIENN